MNALPRGTVVAIAGTGTEVGKTWFAVELLKQARARGLSVSARKPAQSFEPGAPTDAELLAAATGERPELVCPPDRSYPVPMAPPMAADALGLPPISVSQLRAQTSWRSETQLVVIETAGGVRSPIAHDGDNVALMRAFAPPQVVLVADAGLGTINAVRLSMQALVGLRTLVFLNRFDADSDLHRRNRAWLAERDGFEVIVQVSEWWRFAERAHG